MDNRSYAAWERPRKVTVNQTFPNGNGQAVTATGTLSMANTAQNQDACQGAPLTLHLPSN